MSKVVILGGTFNPVHLMHSYILDQAYIELDCDKKYYLINNIPPHKEKYNISNKHRLNMLKIQSLEDNTDVLTYELENMDISYTYNTIKYYLENNPTWEIFFLIGQDNINTLQTWYKFDELTKLIKFIGVNRKGIEQIKSKHIYKYIDIDIDDLSSTDIRLGKRNDINEKVKQYITSNNLYGY